MKEKHKNMGKVVSLIHSTERSLIPIIMTISLLSAISPFINYAGITFILNELLGEKRIAYFVHYCSTGCDSSPKRTIGES